MDELVQFLRARLDEDAVWATEASRVYGKEAYEGGVHWQWVEPETDTPIAVDPSRDEHLTDSAGNFRFSLRSVEEFPRDHVGPLPLFALSSVEEIPVGVAGHIVSHDPARVLREIDADRQLLAQYAEVAANDVDDVEYAHGWANALGLAVRLRASAFSDRPGYREEWRP